MHETFFDSRKKARNIIISSIISNYYHSPSSNALNIRTQFEDNHGKSLYVTYRIITNYPHTPY